VSDTVTTARRWNSFVCPGCRCVFRVPQDHDGTGVVCPACRIMLRLPGPDDELPPLISPATAEAEAIEIEEYEDDADSDEAVAATRSDRNFIAFLVVVAVILVGLVAWWMAPEKNASAPVADVTAPAASPPADTGTTTHNGGAGTGATVEPPKPLLLEIEAAVKAFLEAPTREESLALVLDSAAAARKWEAWLPGETYVAPGFQGIIGDPVTTGTGEGAVSVALARTGDYKLREITLVKRDGCLKVDWDSWVGWSEMTWEEFRTKKPVEPVLFRVQLSIVEYFNFAFSNDREWSSYRLDSQDGMDSFYGYVPRTGELDQRLRPADAGTKTKWVLKLKFPPHATRDNQVLIDSVVAEGWRVEEQGRE
jgi:hypothetical protein